MSLNAILITDNSIHRDSRKYVGNRIKIKQKKHLMKKSSIHNNKSIRIECNIINDDLFFISLLQLCIIIIIISITIIIKLPYYSCDFFHLILL